MIVNFSFVLLLFISVFVSSANAKATISISIRALNRSGDSVVIQWSGVDSPSNLDWLGLYSPPESPNDHFIGYKFLNESSTWKSGFGSISLPLTNLRSNYTFRIFRWSESEIDMKHQDHDQNPLPGTKHLLAESEQLSFGSGGVGMPEQIHLSFTDKVNTMRVMFVAGDGEERFVRYGEEKDLLGNSAAARGMRYEREHMCDSPANSTVGWRDPGWIYDTVMKNLNNGVRYYYQVGSESKGWSEIRSFIARDLYSEETVAFMFGDMGCATPYTTFIRTQDESIATVKWILRDIEALGDKPAFISHIGDISYARGYSWVWDEFFAQIEPIASKVAYHVCIGNHEYDFPAQPWKPDWAATTYGTDGGGECGVPYSLKFNMPGNSSEPTGTKAPPTRNLYYSYDMGSVHFLYISTETNFVKGGSQYEFIKRDLETVNREKTPFVVVQGHRPMYTTSNEVRDTMIRQKMVEHLEPLFVDNNVTLALWGHVHRYERFCPISNNTCGKQWPGSPVHLVIGMAGQDWQPIWQPRPNHPDVPIFPQPEQSMYRTGEFGYTRLVANKEKLTVSFVGNHDGEVHDTVEMLASGEVISGSKESTKVPNLKAVSASATLMRKSESNTLWYVKGAGLMVAGVVLGFIIGFFTRGKKSSSGNRWIPVKNEET
ncbi:PREDICTED: probable inactive purple acid phosphatase 2 isoform X2 [Camelina sativa]|uniref:Purple acid phosphatase n=1 Tax=Camelina sativa TaxID=90675 RepID=A0ABM0WUM7_CAMSA|nr:PREDICTED: probable inactive purple acid phosphatase 2 isoform X1 [Camelina sativa]XP_010476420.1 PREDICTED: probable inactive purple acid phosphatase 2 isoform X2 [Camelina sativa]